MGWGYKKVNWKSYSEQEEIIQIRLGLAQSLKKGVSTVINQNQIAPSETGIHNENICGRIDSKVSTAVTFNSNFRFTDSRAGDKRIE